MSTPLPAPAPETTPETEPFWAATDDGRLRLQRCATCDSVIWYPRGICPVCWGRDLVWFDASGRGAIYSYTVNTRGVGPYQGAEPYVLAYVELDEGPRLLTNIVDARPEDLRVGARVEALFHDTGEGAALVRFALAPGDEPA